MTITSLYYLENLNIDFCRYIFQRTFFQKIQKKKESIISQFERVIVIGSYVVMIDTPHGRMISRASRETDCLLRNKDNNDCMVMIKARNKIVVIRNVG